MGLTALRECDTGVLHVAGEVDTSCAELLVTAVRATITTGPVQTILIDVAATAFLDGAGIAALLTGRRPATEHTIQLRVVNSHGIVRRS